MGTEPLQNIQFGKDGFIYYFFVLSQVQTFLNEYQSYAYLLTCPRNCTEPKSLEPSRHELVHVSRETIFEAQQKIVHWLKMDQMIGPKFQSLLLLIV